MGKFLIYYIRIIIVKMVFLIQNCIFSAGVVAVKPSLALIKGN